MGSVPKIIAALLLVAGCTSSQSGPIQPQTTSTSQEGNEVKKVEGPIILKVDWDYGDGIGVQLQPDGQYLTSPNELRAAAPDLHKRYEHIGALAQIFHKFEPGISDEVFATVQGYDEWWAKWFEPAGFFDNEHGFVGVNPSGLSSDVLHDARLEGDKLVYFSGRVIDIHDGIQAFRNEVDFASEDWTPKIVELKLAGQPRKGLNDRTIAIFGGLVEGYARAQAPTGEVFLAAKPGAGASPFVWRNADKKVEKFTSWATLLAKHPEAGSPEAAKELAYGIANHPLGSGFQLITDSAEYKKEYKDGDWGTEKLRYHVDQIRVTEYTIADWDKIADPVIKDGVLVAYFKQGRQPSRMTYQLGDFAKQPQVEYVELTTSKRISDTEDGPVLNNDPVSPDLITK
jgi:hypothetical protein